MTFDSMLRIPTRKIWYTGLLADYGNFGKGLFKNHVDKILNNFLLRIPTMVDCFMHLIRIIITYKRLILGPIKTLPFFIPSFIRLNIDHHLRGMKTLNF